MSIDYIREHYGVSAKIGGRIRFDFTDFGEGGIAGRSGPHLLVKFANRNHSVPLYPTWKVIYLEAGE